MVDAANSESSSMRLRRAPNLKRGRTEGRTADRIQLERVLGATVSNNAALATDDVSGVIAYPAGCTVVLYNPSTEQQTHIVNASKKSVTCVAFSACGRYVATGECGHQPSVRVWDLLSTTSSTADAATPPTHVADLHGHKFGVSCVAFSPTGRVVVSVGTQHDMIVNVWEWRRGVKVASNKVSTKVKAIAFAANGSHFVTVGNRLVKFWYLDCGGGGGRNKYNAEAVVPLMGRSAILGEQRNNNFVDVACGRSACADSTYVITRSGLLCQFNNRRLLDKWVELRTSNAHALSVGETYIFVGCDNGIVRCFDPHTLNFVTTLPRPHYLGVDVAQGLNIAHMASPPVNAKYPDAVAVSYDAENSKVSCVYNDHSLYIWDVRSILKVGKSDSFLFHSACIWGVEMTPPSSAAALPAGSFLTCSSDDTIRVWTLDRFDDTHLKGGMYARNIYSAELLKIVYVDGELAFIKDRSASAQERAQDTSYDNSVNGVRAIRLSADGARLASGDRAGNIRIHETRTMTATLKIEAHDSEVLCLEFSSPDADGSNGGTLMASASRDRLIHVFDVEHDFRFVQTLDDHSSSITAVRFLRTADAQHQLISCGADKSVIFRKMAAGEQFQRAFHVTGKCTLYDMEVDAGGKHVLTACQDRNVRVYNVAQGRYTRSYKGSVGDDGSLIKLALDASGTYLATSCTDKTLSVFDYYTGECMATMLGHSELATGLRFTNDCRRIISTSGDGCIFVWRLPHDMVVTMHARLNQQAMLAGRRPMMMTMASDSDEEEEEEEEDDEFVNAGIARRFNAGKLPRWAKKKMMAGRGAVSPLLGRECVQVQAQGKWAERVQQTAGMEGIRRSEGHLKSPQVMDEQDGRRQSVYYPETPDPTSGGEYTVTQIDTEELRKSVRRSKRASLPPPLQVSDGDDDEDDDDEEDEDEEASTPSGDNTDANPMSMLSTSMESLYAANKEKYLQATYESLSGGDEAGTPANKSTTITAQYHSRRSTPPARRNVAVVNAAKHTKTDLKTTKKREELLQLIAETKRKLQSIGYVSPLKASQSICDLSHVPEKETRVERQRSAVQRSGSNVIDTSKQQATESSPTTSSMRRACSLSDLSLQQHTPKRGDGGKTVVTKNARQLLLQHSDSEDEQPRVKQAQMLPSRLMRPTISSQNKATHGTSSSSNNKSANLRLHHAKRHHSTLNLATVHADGTSSDELETAAAKPMNGKPAVPPRCRVTHPVAANRVKWIKPDAGADPVKESNQLCHDVATNLVNAASEVVRLHGALTGGGAVDADNNLLSAETRSDMVRTLQASVIGTQKLLQDLSLQILKHEHHRRQCDVVNQTDSVKKLNDLIDKGFPTDETSLVSIMQQYSDILLGMMQQKIQDCSSSSSK